MSEQALESEASESASELGGDLSQGTISDKDEKRLNMGLEAHRHQLNQQITIANSALCFVAVLFMVAIGMGICLVYVLAQGDGEKIHWHAAILVAAFVVPPTIVMVALLRAAYATKEKEASSVPALAFVKEVVGVVKQAWR